eukprot:COSAG01_NODE_5477_length_4236_cov_2.696157_7_plen_53_part_00
MQCSVCEFMVTELDNALHAAQASNRSVLIASLPPCLHTGVALQPLLTTRQVS